MSRRVLPSPLRSAGLALGVILLGASGCRALVGITDTSELPGDDDGVGDDGGSGPGDDATTPSGDGSPGPTSDGGLPDGHPPLSADGAPPTWAQPESVCSADGFCWYAPLPQGNALGGLWSASASDVWSAGAGGTVLHFDGTSWTGTSIGSLVFDGIAGDGHGHVYAVGEGASGKGAFYKWTQTGDAGQGSWVGDIVAGPTLHAVWSSPDDGGVTWAVGEQGTAYAYDGGTLTSSSTGVSAVLYGLTGTSSGVMYAVGNESTVLSFDPVAATWVNLGTDGVAANTDFYGAWIAADGTLWVVGEGGTVLKRASDTWSQVAIVDAGSVIGDLYAVVGDNAGHIWVAGESTASGIPGNGTVAGVVGVYDVTAGSWTWTQPGQLGPYASISLDPTTGQVWTAGAAGRMARWNGTSWELSPRLTDANLHAVAASSVPGASDVYAVGDQGTIAHYDGTAWTLDTSPVTGALQTVWSGGGVTLAAGVAELQLVDGGWQQVSSIGPATASIWGSSGTDVYATSLAPTVPQQGTTAAFHNDGVTGWHELVVDGGVDSGFPEEVYAPSFVGVTGFSAETAVLFGAFDRCMGGLGGFCQPFSGWLGVGNARSGFVSQPLAAEPTLIAGAASGSYLWVASATILYRFPVMSGSSIGSGSVVVGLPDSGVLPVFTSVAANGSQGGVVAIAQDTLAYEADGGTSAVKAENSGFASPAGVTVASGALWIVGANGAIVGRVSP